MSEFWVAVAAIVLHVTNYNWTAHYEYKTRFFTKLLGRNAVYYYAVYLVASALIRDHFMNNALNANTETFTILPAALTTLIGGTLFVLGFALNLWTLQALGIKGMYNGDSFGWLFDAPVTGGPYQYFSDPQYVGTTAAAVGSAFYYRSVDGFLLAVAMGIVFYISVHYVEGPHMGRIYSNKRKSKLY